MVNHRAQAIRVPVPGKQRDLISRQEVAGVLDLPGYGVAVLAS